MKIGELARAYLLQGNSTTVQVKDHRCKNVQFNMVDSVDGREDMECLMYCGNWQLVEHPAL